MASLEAWKTDAIQHMHALNGHISQLTAQAATDRRRFVNVYAYVGEQARELTVWRLNLGQGGHGN